MKEWKTEQRWAMESHVIVTGHRSLFPMGSGCPIVKMWKLSLILFKCPDKAMEERSMSERSVRSLQHAGHLPVQMTWIHGRPADLTTAVKCPKLDLAV